MVKKALSMSYKIQKDDWKEGRKERRNEEEEKGRIEGRKGETEERNSMKNTKKE
jgi:hypothetical protein